MSHSNIPVARKSSRTSASIHNAVGACSAAATLILIVATGAAPVEAASFDCKKASTVIETLICQDPSLSQMDERLSAAYSAARAKSSNPSQLIADERTWMVQRNQCQTTACLSHAYSKRIAELGGESMPLAPAGHETNQTQSASASSMTPTNEATFPVRPSVAPQSLAQQNAAPQTSAPQSLGQPNSDQSMRQSTPRDEYIAACAKATPMPGEVNAWVGKALYPAISSLEQAVQARRDAIDDRGRPDALSGAIQWAQQESHMLGIFSRKYPNNPIYALNEACDQKYVAFLQSIDAESLEIARKQADQESAARIEAQRQAHESQQGIADAAREEQVRKQKAEAAEAVQKERAEEVSEGSRYVKTVVTDLLSKANNGDAGSQYMMGNIYDTAVPSSPLLRGFPFPKDDVEAAKWYSKAASEGFSLAQRSLCQMYYDGRGVPKSLTKAKEFCMMAARQNDPVAGPLLARFHFEDLLKRAMNGDAEAEFEVAKLYTENVAYPGQDNEKAVDWFRKASDQGLPAAELNLGYMEFNGIGVQKDILEAASWFKKAADQGNALAQNDLGYIYLKGEQGIPQDAAQAVAWFRKAADQGLAGAQEQLGRLYEAGQGVPQDNAKASEWYLKAATQGDFNAKEAYENLREKLAYTKYVREINQKFGTLDSAEKFCVIHKSRFGGQFMMSDYIALLAQDPRMESVTFSTPGYLYGGYEIKAHRSADQQGEWMAIHLKTVYIDESNGEIYVDQSHDKHLAKCLVATEIDDVDGKSLPMKNDTEGAVALNLIVQGMDDRLINKIMAGEK